MGNAIAVRGRRGMTKPSAKALAGLELQNALPKARIVYVSATGATEVMNFAYAKRLGLWGEGTSFADAPDFINKVSAGGVAAMELVARDLKAMGKYSARSLSYDGVKYQRLEHTLTPEQREIYDELAGAWQIALHDINKAMETTGITGTTRSGRPKTLNGDAKSAAMSAFWGAHQRFFNQIITAMQLPTVIKGIEKDLKADKAVVLQLVNTNEAATTRALSRMEEEDELEDLDLTPREQMMEFVRNSYPVNQYETFTDDNGNEASRLVLDSQGNPVENPEAVAAREALLNRIGSIRVPDNPLDMVINHFGVDKVAEVSGRTRRVIEVEDEKGRHRIIDKRSKAKAMVDADNFMNDRKQILAFTYAGGTGRSYHADLTVKNQRLRMHYLVQPGWRADRAVQGLGRTHRSNQKQPPEYYLVTTDLKGQKRFISSIARRLDQLGALTKGQRQTGGQGLFGERDNLESRYANDALNKLIEDIARDQVPDIGLGEFSNQLGLRLMDENGNLNVSNIPDIPQFLNRLLSMKINMQTKVFDAFSDRLDVEIAKAIQNGTLDAGLETVRAKKIDKLNEQVIHTDKKTGAQTKFVELELTHDANIIPWEKSDRFGKSGYVQNVKSGRIWALSEPQLTTDTSTGDVINTYKATGINYGIHKLEEAEVNDPEKYTKLSKSDAKDLWNTEYQEHPKEVKERQHLVTGALLPIYSRLPTGNARIVRIQTSAGERMIGRLIPPRQLDATKERLGAETTAIAMTPKEVFDNILHHGYSIELANNWQIVRRKVAGEDRIEIKGPNYREIELLKKYGVFDERIQWETRYFLPTTEQGVSAIEKIIENNPIIRAIPSKSTEDIIAAGKILSSEKGVVSLDLLAPGIRQAIDAALTVKGNIHEAMPYIEELGRNIYDSGKRKFDSWQSEMKQRLGELWESIKRYARDIWESIADPIEGERGSFSFRKLKPEDEVAEGERSGNELEKTYEKYKDVWIGNKDVRILKAKVESANLQKDIMEALGKKRYDREAQDIDKAIQIHIDTKRSPEDVKEYWDKLTPEQKRIVTLSQNLPSEVMPVVEAIERDYRKIGLEALEEEVIKNVLDNYAARTWDFGEGKKGAENLRKFGTRTRHALQRKFATIIEGWGEDFKLKYEGATTNLRILKEEVGKTIVDKNFLDAASKIKDVDGRPLLSTIHFDSYDRVEHPNFKKWKWAGKIEEGKTEEGLLKTHGGKNFFVDKEGNIFERREIYAPHEQAKNLNNILGVSKLWGVPGIPTISKYNAIFKAWILLSSFFHNLAFSRNYFLGTPGTWKHPSIRNTYQEGNKAIQALDPDIVRGVRNGLTLGIKQDWEEDLARQRTFIDNVLDKTKATSAVRNFVKDLRERQTNYLFDVMGAGLKSMSYLNSYRDILRRNPDMDPNAAAKIAARLQNDNYGGLHLARKGRDPTLQHIFRLFTLASDWIESNIDLVAGAFKKGPGTGEARSAGRKAYQRLVGGWYLKALGVTALANYLLAGGDLKKMEDNYKIAWYQNNLRWLSIDVTPIYKALGGTGEQHKYFPLIGHMLDPLRLLTHPVRFAQNKGSVLYRTLQEALTGQDWTRREFTTLEELLETGKTVKYGKGHPIEWNQFPSYILSQVIGTMPVQLENFIRYVNGEMEAFDAIGQSVGAGVVSTYRVIKSGFERYAADLQHGGVPTDKSELKRKLEDELRAKEPGARERLEQARKEGKITSDEKEKIEDEAEKSKTEKLAKGMTVDQLAKGWTKATPEEKKILADIFEDKIDRAVDAEKITKETARRYYKMLKEK